MEKHQGQSGNPEVRGKSWAAVFVVVSTEMKEQERVEADFGLLDSNRALVHSAILSCLVPVLG